MRSIVVLTLALLFSANVCADCSEVIGKMPGYSCKQQTPLGSGASAEVFIVTKDDKMFILRVTNKTPETLREVEFLRRINEAKIDCVARLYEVQQDEKNLYEVLEFGALGTLERYIDRKLSQDRVLDLFIKIAKCVNLVHGQEIIHADLKPENIVMTDINTPKLIDMDLSVETKIPATSRGTPYYADPELLRNWNKYQQWGPQQDIWSLGVILFEMITTQRPWAAMTIEQYAKLKRRYVLPAGSFKVFADVLPRMLRSDPKQRDSLPNIITILENEQAKSGHEVTMNDLAFDADAPSEVDKPSDINRRPPGYKPDFFEMFGELIFVSLLVFLVIPLAVWIISRKARAQQVPVEQPLVQQRDFARPVPVAVNQA